MTYPICGRVIRDTRPKLICRRKLDHEGPCSWTKLRIAKKPNLEIAAEMSGLLMSLPAGDYTRLVKRVYINHRTVMIEFDTAYYDVLVAERKKFNAT
jgi:hypothetical protein